MAAEKPVKRPPLPVVLVSNHVLDGDVLFHDGSEWVLRPEAALVAQDEETALKLEAIRDASDASGEVIEPYLVAVNINADGTTTPVHFREKIRATGPSVRPDLGKQAETAGAS